MASDPMETLFGASVVRIQMLTQERDEARARLAAAEARAKRAEEREQAKDRALRQALQSMQACRGGIGHSAACAIIAALAAPPPAPAGATMGQCRCGKFLIPFGSDGVRVERPTTGYPPPEVHTPNGCRGLTPHEEALGRLDLPATPPAAEAQVVTSGHVSEPRSRSDAMSADAEPAGALDFAAEAQGACSSACRGWCWDNQRTHAEQSDCDGWRCTDHRPAAPAGQGEGTK